MGLYRRNKNNNKPLVRQIIDLVPRWMLTSITKQFNSDKGCSKYKTYDQFVALTFGQLNKCFTLSDISTGIGVSEIYISDDCCPIKIFILTNKPYKQRIQNAFNSLHLLLD